MEFVENTMFTSFLPGTREGKTQTVAGSDDSDWQQKLITILKHIFWCFVPPQYRDKPEAESNQQNTPTQMEIEDQIREEEQEPEQVITVRIDVLVIDLFYLICAL